MNDIKKMYAAYLKGVAEPKKISQEQADLLRHGADDGQHGFGRFVVDNENGTWTAIYGYGDRLAGYAVRDYISEALAAGFLMDVDERQLNMFENILNCAKSKGQAIFEDVEDALLSPAPEGRDETLVSDDWSRFYDMKAAFKENNGVYDPVHGIYIDPTVTDACEEKCITLYDVSMDDIEECMMNGTKFLDEVPGQIHVVNGSPVIAKIPVDGPHDQTIDLLVSTIARDERWCDVTGLDIGGFKHFQDIAEKNYRIENQISLPEAARTHDEWRDGMVQQVANYMDRIDGLDSVDARNAFPTLADTFEQVDFTEPQIVTDLLNLYSKSDDSGKATINQMFYVLSGKTFDLFLMEASEACEETLGSHRDPLRSQDVHAKGLSEKASASREASEHLLNGRIVDSSVRDENTVGE